MGTLTDPFDVIESESIGIVREASGRIAPHDHLVVHTGRTFAVPNATQRGAA